MTRRKRPERPVYLNAVQRAIARARPLALADVTNQQELMQHALVQFSQGVNCADHWCSLADAANMAETLADMGLGAGVEVDALILAGQQALFDVHGRHSTRGTWTLYPAELKALDDLVWLHGTVQLPACSYGEFSDALGRTRNRMQQALAGNAARGTLVIDGGIGRSQPHPNEPAAPAAPGA
jgi:hypothetical protein